VEKIAHVTVSIALGDSPESANLRIQGEGGPRLVAYEADDGCPTCFEDSDRTDLCARLVCGASALAAPPYPAPPVVTVTAAPAPGAPAGTADTATTLANTGAGFNVGATVLIAVTVLLLGVGLVLLGRHLRRSNTD